MYACYPLLLKIQDLRRLGQYGARFADSREIDVLSHRDTPQVPMETATDLTQLALALAAFIGIWSRVLARAQELGIPPFHCSRT